MSYRAIVVYPENDYRGVVITGLEDLQRHVGGLIEHVTLMIEGRMVDAYINEEGKLLDLDVNDWATMYYPSAWDYIVGNVVLVGPVDAEGNDTDVPDWVVEEVRKMERGVIA